MASFLNQRSLEGWDIAYNSAESNYNVGVIDYKLLPASRMVYRYYFSLNPTSVDDDPFAPGSNPLSYLAGGVVNAAGFASSTRISRDLVEFTLDFVVSDRKLAVYTVTESDMANGNLTLPFYVLDLTYAFRCELDSSNKVTGIYKRDGTLSVVGEGVDLPIAPSPDERGKAWFDYYDSFDGDGEYTEYNHMNGKVLNPSRSFTLRERTGAKATDTNQINLHNMNLGDKFLIEYEGIEEHLYRQEVHLELVKFNFIIGGVSVNAYDTPFVENRRVEHYLWKTWIDDSGIHSGWRISEAWNSELFCHEPVNADANYDPDTNPLDTSLKNSQQAEKVVFNMSDNNLKLPDRSRIGYDLSYAEYLLDQVNPEVEGDNNQDGNDIDASNITKTNFSFERVGNVTYEGDGDVFIEIGGALGVLLNANNLSYSGFWESQVYNYSYPRNTRIVNVRNRASNGALKNIIAVNTLKLKKGLSAASVQDPLHCFVSEGRINYLIFDDDEHKIFLSSLLNSTALEIFENFTTNPSLGSVNNVSPGASIFIRDYYYQTGIDDSTISSNTSPKINGSTVTQGPLESVAEIEVEEVDSFSFQRVLGGQDGQTEYDDFLINVDNTRILLGFEISYEVEQDPSLFYNFKIRGWENSISESRAANLFDAEDQPKYEYGGTQLKRLETNRVFLGTWEGISQLEIFTQATTLLLTLKVIYLSNGSSLNQISDAKSIASATDHSGALMIFYTNTDDRLNYIQTKNGIDWDHVENVVIRGAPIYEPKSIVNRMNETVYLFHFVNDLLIMDSFDGILFNLQRGDREKETKVLDLVRRSWSHLVYGDMTDYRETNHLASSDDFQIFYNRSDPAYKIYNGDSLISNEHNLSEWNHYIITGRLTEDNGLASANSGTKEYTVYQNNVGVIRLFIKEESSYRCLESADEGENWSDAWNYIESQGAVAKINSISNSADLSEGENLSVFYNDFSNELYLFFFYDGVLYCKFFSDDIFYKNKEQISEIFNNMSVYAVAGNITKAKAFRTSDDGINVYRVIIGEFQEDQDNVNKYYPDEIYLNQQAVGHVTKKGLIKVSLVRDGGSLDSYVFDGKEWLPERLIVGES